MCIYVYTYIYISRHVYIYIYIERERERHTHTYIYIYIYIKRRSRTDCFVVSQLFSVARHARYPKMRLKPNLHQSEILLHSHEEYIY